MGGYVERGVLSGGGMLSGGVMLRGGYVKCRVCCVRGGGVT